MVEDAVRTMLEEAEMKELTRGRVWRETASEMEAEVEGSELQTTCKSFQAREISNST